MPTVRYFVLVLAAIFVATAAIPSSASDHFPNGFATPEGAACDFARAFILRDPVLFDEAVLQPFGSGESRARYETFLIGTKSFISEESRRPADSGPREITHVFAARSMSRSGPASYAYSAFGFADLKFVDVVVATYGGGTSTNRTLVVKDSAGRWHVHPKPSIHPMLSTGLNEESPSKVELPRKKDPS